MEKFTIARRGYEPKEVDAYIEKLEQELQRYKENSQSITNAIVHAERASREIIDEAKKKAETIEQDAFVRMDSLEKRVKHIRMKLDSFQSQYNQIIHKYIITMNNDDFSDMYASLDRIASAIAGNMNELDKLVDLDEDNSVVDHSEHTQYQEREFSPQSIHEKNIHAQNLNHRYAESQYTHQEPTNLNNTPTSSNRAVRRDSDKSDHSSNTVERVRKP